MRNNFYGLVLFVMSCSEIPLHKETVYSAQDQFFIFWNDFNKYYSHFPVKNIDWDSVYESSSVFLNHHNTEDDLKTVLIGIVDKLSDEHVGLRGSDFTHYYRKDSAIPLNESLFDPLIKIKRELGYRVYSDSILIVRIGTFSGQIGDFEILVDSLESSIQSKPIKKIIWDVRSNAGGNESNAFSVCQAFNPTKSYTFRLLKYRNSEDRYSGFTDPIESKTRIGHTNPYLRNIVLLNSKCKSACEGFVLYLDAIPSTRIFGTRSSGSSGNPILRELPNGWIYSISNWLVIKPNGDYLEDNGIVPDVEVADVNELNYIQIQQLINSYN